MEFYQKTIEDALRELGGAETGLSSAQAGKRIRENGRNALIRPKKKNLIRRLAEQLANPMILILLAAAAVSVGIAAAEGGTLREYAEAGIILAVVVLNSILGVYQETKAEKAIEALQEMSAATARVWREGAVLHLPADELVTGDIVLIEAGNAVPADMRLIRCASLRVEEAALTGESVPSDKSTDALSEDEPGTVPLGDRRNMVYMGSSVAYGRGEGVVTATGMQTEMGKIAGILQSTQEGETPLQKRLSALSKTLSALVLGICAAIFAFRLLAGGARSAEGIVDSFMLAVSLAVAAIPEGLAAVVTIVLSIGVTNMARRNAIIRRLTAVETLGCTQVICSDKTGTLTRNVMTVTECFGDRALAAKAMALCCDSELSPGGDLVGDPTENALVAFALAEGYDPKALADEFPRVAEAPFDSVRKMMSTFHRTADGVVQYTKGAPDEVLRVCTHASRNGQAVPLSGGIRREIIAQNKAYADRALRVLACARREWDDIPADCSPRSIENGLTFIGLEAMTDPVRPEAKAAVNACKRSGIKVVMITGDHKETAAAVAKELGIIGDVGQAMTGRELDRLSDAEFESRIETTFVYARVQPEHKVRIVGMWKRKGYVTAMTGDGVNDAPAMKTGDIGVGMGVTGTDVTKNVADMVLADDNFATIIAAVEEGRRIYDNIRKTLQFLLSTNLCEIVAIVVATVMGFVLFKPVHLLFINLITDTLPAVALGMERAEEGLMERPPRGQSEGVFADGLGLNSVIQGFLIALLTLAAYFLSNAGNRPETAITAAFITLSMCEIAHAFTMRSLKQSVFTMKARNKALWGAAALSLALTLSVVYAPPLAGVFSLEPLNAPELALSLGLALLIVPLAEGVKASRRRTAPASQGG